MKLDLFGKEIGEMDLAEIQAAKKKLERRRSTIPRGYAALPGTGPAGKTCKGCAHYVVKVLAKSYRKCGLMRARWTGGGASDILAGSPACSRFEEPT